MLEIFPYRSEIRILAPHYSILKKFFFPLKITLIHLKTGTLKAPQSKQADEPGIPGFTLNRNPPSEFFVSLTKFLNRLWEPAVNAKLPVFLSPTGRRLFLSPQKLSQRTADSPWLQVRVPLETSTVPVLRVWVQVRWHLVTRQARPHLGRSTPHFGLQSREPGHSIPAPLVLLHLQPDLQLEVLMVMLSVTAAGPCRLAWVGADGVTAWGSNFTQSDFTPQSFLTAVSSIFSW